jgi:16S rRNA (guanine966-N2)-methyltransferase
VWRGRVIDTPPGLDVRPTRQVVRQALFNMLGQAVAGQAVVDLYAGAGTVGFEALSRGARQVTFVDRSPQSARLIAATAARLGCRDRVGAITADCADWLRRRPPEVALAGLCYLDAPYRDDGVAEALRLLAEAGPSLIVCEHHRDRALPAELGPLLAVRTARYGLTRLTMYRAGR